MTDIIKLFLISGCLGKLSLGMPTNLIGEIIGKPAEGELSATRRRKIWEIGNLQLSFFKGKLDIISLFWREGESRLPTQIVESGLAKVESTKYNKFVDILLESGIQFEPDLSESDQSMICIKLRSGVRVYFELQELYSMVIM
ncbi:MAG: hypothetical protein AB1489_29725 [Acidobacteriota bacterium]